MLYRLPAGQNNEMLHGLSSWLADQLVDEAAKARSLQRSLERQAAQESTISGMLLDLAEQSCPVSITTQAHNLIEGQVVAVGEDFAVVRDGRTPEVFVPLRAVAIVSGISRECHWVGTRLLAPYSFADALEELAADKAEVVANIGSSAIKGRLTTVGADLFALAISRPLGNDYSGDHSGEPHSATNTYVAISAVDHMLVVAR